jgi:hypothetical protein
MNNELEVYLELIKVFYPSFHLHHSAESLGPKKQMCFSLFDLRKMIKLLQGRVSLSENLREHSCVRGSAMWRSIASLDREHVSSLVSSS